MNMQFTVTHARIAIFLVLLVGLALTPLWSAAQGQTGWQWYKVDPHVHSTVSADAYSDIGIHAQAAQAHGYDAIFLTDHNGASSFQINHLNANHMAFEDTYTRWDLGTFGSLSATANDLESSPVNTGTSSLKLKSSSTTSGETYVWTKRGPNFRSGDIILQVSIYPTRIDPGSGLYVSVSIGGDPTVVASPDGYTTAAGVISPGKSTVLVWQLGSGRAPSSDPNARVLTYSLGNYNLNAWNTYTINVTNALADIPAADRPLDYNGLTYLKMTAAANNGTAEGYFDTFSIDASVPSDPAAEYVYRTSVVDDFNTSTFKVFPSYEMGQQKHTNRFNFGITTLPEYRSYTYGSDGILETQQNGYPAQLNHPGTTITAQEAINTQGKGADFLEVREQTWIDAWDAILQQGVQILGAWSSDTHTGESAGRAATYIYAPALDFDKFVQSLYEGRTYTAPNNFSGRTIFNLDSASQEPYPARYPVYVSDAQATANVHLLVTAGLGSGYTMRWYRDGVLTATDNQTGASYDATKSISLSGARTYVRAEVRASSSSIKGMTQPIFFVDVPGLPVDKSFYIDTVTSANGSGYNKLLTKGITASNWDAANNALAMTLEDPLNALANLRITSNSAPQQVMINGASIAASSTLTNFNAATVSAWYYDAPAQLLYLKVKHTIVVSNVVLGFGGTLPTPTTTPTITSTFTPTATGSPSPTPTPTTQGAPVTFLPVADTYVSAGSPATNYGTSTTLRTDASPEIRSYLRFNAQGLSAAVTRATLRIYVNSSSSIGYQVHSVGDNTWSETSMTYNNAPAVGSFLGASGAFSGGTWTSVDVTSFITGNSFFNLALTTTSATATSLASRESGANAPQLVVETQSGLTATPSSTPTNTETLVPTATSTPTNLPTSTATATHTPTDLPTATSTPTDLATSTATATHTPTDLPTVTSTPTDLPTATSTPTNLPTATATPTDLPTATSTPTNLPTATATPTDLPTATSTPTNLPTATATATDLPTATSTPTDLPTATATATDLPTATSTPTNLPTATATATDTPVSNLTLTFLPVDDAYIRADRPSNNYGTAATLMTDYNPVKHFLIKFAVTGVNGQVSSAKLRLYNSDSAPQGGDFHRMTDTTWSQATVTWNNAPVYDSAVIASMGKVSAGNWYEVDLSSLINGNGVFSVRVTLALTNGADYSSKEGVNPPELIVTVQ